MITVRNATPDDITAITGIYNYAVIHTAAVWHDSPVSTDDRMGWYQHRLAAGYPVLVAVNEGNDVTGFASYSDWRAFDGYRYTVEHSVYVHQDCHRQGIGAALLSGLITAAGQMKKHVMIAGIDSGNQASIALHRKFGFVDSGTVKQVGWKFDSWLDLTFMQLIINDKGAVRDGNPGGFSAPA